MTRNISRRTFLAGAGAMVASAAAALPWWAWADELAVQNKAIVIVHTNDVHCAIDQNLGYARLADMVAATREAYGPDVTLVDAGDAIQGKAVGTLSQGLDVVTIMNACNYDYVIPGNHEYDYGMDAFNKVVDAAKAPYLSANFTNLYNGRLVFDAYALKTYATAAGSKTVAFVGVTTPQSLTTSSPANFQNSAGETIYGFCGDDTGDELAAAVQSTVDAARTAGADYVVLIAHLGQKGSLTQWRSDTLAAKTRDIDVIIDGHSHEEYVQVLTNADGKNVVVTQTGTQLVNMGRVILDPVEGTITASTSHGNATAELVSEWSGTDAAVQNVIDEINANLEQTTSRVVGSSDVTLYAYEPGTASTWAVRTHNTNAGNFVADAYWYEAYAEGVNPDLVFFNAGAVRSNIEAGEVTYGDLININPAGNRICYATVTGQQILDALECSVRKLPEPAGYFPQVSGVTFTVRTDVESTVEVNSASEFVGVTGEYRVRDVKIGGEPLDLSATYTIVSTESYLRFGGNSMTMLIHDAADVTYLSLNLDRDVLEAYLKVLGTIGEEYADPEGDGRIKLMDGPDAATTDAATTDAATTDAATTDAATTDAATTNAATTGAATTGAATTGATTSAATSGSGSTGARSSSSQRLPQTGDTTGSLMAAGLATVGIAAVAAGLAAGYTTADGER